MALPIDPAKIKNTAEAVQKSTLVDVHINVYYDESTNVNMLTSMRDYLDSADNTVYINFIDLQEHKLYTENEPDFTVILSGEAKLSVMAYSALRSLDIPSLLIAIDPQSIVESASVQSVNIKKCDFICPSFASYQWTNDSQGNQVIDFSVYNASMDKSLKKKFNNWLYYVSEEVQVAYAAKFPFVRELIANRIVNATSIENAGVGAIKILPGADMPIMTLNQARMLLELAAIYNYEVNTDRIIEIVILVLTAFGLKYLSKFVNKNVPVPEFIIDAAFGFGGTQLLGRISKEYFEKRLAPEGLVDKVKSMVGRK